MRSRSETLTLPQDLSLVETPETDVFNAETGDLAFIEMVNYYVGPGFGPQDPQNRATEGVMTGGWDRTAVCVVFTQDWVVGRQTSVWEVHPRQL